MATDFDPHNVDLTTADPKAVICALAASENEYNASLGARVSAIFVILIVSSAATFFPVLAARVRWLRVNIYVYLFARYFGAGVIVATAFIQYAFLTPSIQQALTLFPAFSTPRIQKSVPKHA